MTNSRFPTAEALRRFQRSIVTKRPGTCSFCSKPTTPGIDHAALDNGKWIAVCDTCANSTVAQAKALLIAVQAAAAEYTLTDEQQATISAHVAGIDLTAVLGGNASERDNVAAVTALTNALAAARTHKPADESLVRLQAVLTGTTATAWERDFAASIIDQINRGKTLSEKQQATVARILDGASKPATGASTCTPENGGIYVVGADTYYLVRESKAGRLYTMILASTPQPGVRLDWQYNTGGIHTVRRSGRAITAAEAAALGHVTSHCCFCGHELRDEGDGRSVAVGYGPTCASNRGLPWG